MMGSKKTCKYWAMGKCKYGNNCKFAHLGPSKTSGQTSNNGTFAQFNRFGPLNSSSFNQGSFSATQKQERSNSEIINSIKQDLTNTLWPFSCYGYDKEKPCIITGDVSPEELRCLAYDHYSKYRNLQQYHSIVNNLSEEMKQKKAKVISNPLGAPTPANQSSIMNPSFVNNNPFESQSGSAFGSHNSGDSNQQKSSLFGGSGGINPTFNSGQPQPSVFGSSGGFFNPNPSAAGSVFGNVAPVSSLGGQTQGNSQFGGSLPSGQTIDMDESILNKVGGSAFGGPIGFISSNIGQQNKPNIESGSSNSFFGNNSILQNPTQTAFHQNQNTSSKLAQQPQDLKSPISSEALEIFKSERFTFRNIPEVEPPV